jgi:hypothetical protein
MLASVSSPIRPSWFQQPLHIDLPASLVAPLTLLEPPPAKLVGGSPREFGFGVLSAICKPGLVDRILDECGRHVLRCRLLPARLTVYAHLVMCLRADLSYDKLMHHLAEVADTPAGRTGHGAPLPGPRPTSCRPPRGRLLLLALVGVWSPSTAPPFQVVLDSVHRGRWRPGLACQGTRRHPRRQAPPRRELPGPLQQGSARHPTRHRVHPRWLRRCLPPPAHQPPRSRNRPCPPAGSPLRRALGGRDPPAIAGYP